MTDFLDEKRDEIDDRLAELKPLVEEYNRLLAAAAALRGIDGLGVAGAVVDIPGPVPSAPSAVPSAPSAAPSAPSAAPSGSLRAPSGSLRAPSASRRVEDEAPSAAEEMVNAGNGDGVSSAEAEDSEESDSLVAAPPMPRPGGGVRRAGRPKGSGTRAAEALRIVREHPGVTIPELADRMGIKQNYLYRVLPELVQEGKIAKQGRGWHPRAA